MNFKFDSKAIFVVAAFALLALYPLVAGKFGIDLVTKIMVFAIFALSLELLVGGTGLVCFGQAAFFGIGAYAAVLLSPKNDAASLLWLLPAAVVAAAIYALAVRHRLAPPCLRACSFPWRRRSSISHHTEGASRSRYAPPHRGTVRTRGPRPPIAW